MTNNSWLKSFDAASSSKLAELIKKEKPKGVIACYGKYSNSIQEELEALHLHHKDCFLFTGNVSDENVKALVKTCFSKNLPIIVWNRENSAKAWQLLTSKRLYPNGIDICAINAGKEEQVKDLLQLKNISSLCFCGYQTYLCSNATLKKLSQLNSELLRLGEIRDNIHLVEPLFRDKNLFVLDFNAMRYSDYPLSAEYSNPNGIYAEEICHLARYIGLSLGKRNIFITDSTVPEKKDTGIPKVCNRLIAQTIYHICVGICDNTEEDPYNCNNSDNFEQKIVKMYDNEQELEFLTSIVTGRWWVKIPVMNNKSFRYIACSKEDYDIACSGELPYKWLIFYQKLNLV